jgi:hypothetical protein
LKLEDLQFSGVRIFSVVRKLRKITHFERGTLFEKKWQNTPLCKQHLLFDKNYKTLNWQDLHLI